MIMSRYSVKMTFTEDVLGTVAKDPEIYATYIASKAPANVNVEEEIDTVPVGGAGRAMAGFPTWSDREQAEALPGREERGWTGFHTLPDGRPCLYDYVVKGFFKDAVSMLNRAAESKEDKMMAHKKIIDGLVFVTPRRIPLILPAGGVMGVLERPLRAQTAQGERIALARSDTCPAGTTMEYQVMVLGKEPTEAMLRNWLSYAQFRGFGQWRSASWGRADAEITALA